MDMIVTKMYKIYVLSHLCFTSTLHACFSVWYIIQGGMLSSKITYHCRLFDYPDSTKYNYAIYSGQQHSTLTAMGHIHLLSFCLSYRQTHIHTNELGTKVSPKNQCSSIQTQLSLTYNMPLSHVGIILRLGEMCTMCEKYPVCTVCTGSKRYTIQLYVQGPCPAPGIMNECWDGCAFAVAQCHVGIPHL